MAFSRPWVVALALALITAALTYHATRLRIDWDWTGFLPEDSQAVRTAREIERDFPRGFDTIIVALRCEKPGQQRLLVQAADGLAELFQSDSSYVSGIDYKISPETWRYFGHIDIDDSKFLALMDDAEWNAIHQDLAIVMKIKDWSALDPESSHCEIIERLAHARTRMQTPFLPGGPSEQDPTGLLGQIRSAIMPRFGPDLLPQRGNYAISRDGRVLAMSVIPTGSAFNVVDAHHTVRHLERRVKEYLKFDGAELQGAVFASFAGRHEAVTRAVQYVQRDLKYLLVVGFLLILLLFVVVFRKAEAMVYVSLPVVLGIDWTLGLTRLIYGELTAATLVFVFLIIGLGFEFCLHIYNRFIDELYASKDYRRALEISLSRTGKGIWTSAIALSLVFATLTLTPSAGLRELGAVAAIGVLCVWLSTMFALPTMIAFKARIGKGRVRPIARPALGLDRAAGTVAGYPRATLVFGFLLTVYLAFWASGLEFRSTPKPDMEEARKETELSEKYFKEYPEALPRPSNPILALISAPTLQEALERNDLLFENLVAIQERYGIISIDSLRRVLPSIKSQIAFRERLKNLDMDRLSQSLDAARVSRGMARDTISPLLAILGSARALPTDSMFLEYSQEAESDPAFEQAVRRYLSARQAESADGAKTYSVVTAIYPEDAALAVQDISAFLIDAGQGVEGLRFAGDALLGGPAPQELRQALAQVSLIAAAILFVALSIHFHSIFKALGVLAPVVCVFLWVLGAMALGGIHLHFFSLILLPLVGILPVDHNLQFLQRYEEKQDMWPSLAQVGRAMLTASLTSMLVLGGLAFAKYEGLSQMGLLMVFGNGFALLGSLTLLPALVRLRELGVGPLGVIGQDEGVEKNIEDVP